MWTLLENGPSFVVFGQEEEKLRLEAVRLGCFRITHAKGRDFDDAGDGYGYEKGLCAWLHFQWNDAERKLTHEARATPNIFLPIGRRIS